MRRRRGRRWEAIAARSAPPYVWSSGAYAKTGFTRGSLVLDRPDYFAAASTGRRVPVRVRRGTFAAPREESGAGARWRARWVPFHGKRLYSTEREEVLLLRRGPQRNAPRRGPRRALSRTSRTCVFHERAWIYQAGGSSSRDSKIRRRVSMERGGGGERGRLRTIPAATGGVERTIFDVSPSVSFAPFPYPRRSRSPVGGATYRTLALVSNSTSRPNGESTGVREKEREREKER